MARLYISKAAQNRPKCVSSELDRLLSVELENRIRLSEQVLQAKHTVSTTEARLNSTSVGLASLSQEFKATVLKGANEASLLLRTDLATQNAIQQLGNAGPRLKFPWFGRRRSRSLLRMRRMLIASSGVFDGSWYLAQNPDVAAADYEPIDHFNIHGSIELRDPGPLFNSERYLIERPDVRLAHVGAFSCTISCMEGRRAVTGFQSLMMYLIFGLALQFKSLPRKVSSGI